MKTKGKILSLVTALCMVFALLPTQVSVFADDAEAFTVETEDGTYTYADNLLTISEGGTYTIYQTDGTDTATSDTIKVTASDAVTINLAGVNIKTDSGTPFEITGSGDVTIKLSNTNTLTATEENYAGLQKTSTSNTLTITSAAGDGETSGTLTATGGYHAAGIGGGYQVAGNYITIAGGTITATSGYDGAGIGGGFNADGSYITITGGTVTADSTIGNGGTSVTSYGGGAAIGGGSHNPGSYITISGGTVTATGWNGAGIGGGWGSGTDCDGTGSNITITGGTVTAVGESYGAGIGGGYKATGTNITIGGGYITASASSGSAIGSGNEGSTASGISITGGYFGTGSTSAGTVYGVTVASGCTVYNNTDSGTSGTYPYVVGAGSFVVTGGSGYGYSGNVLTISSGGEYNISMAPGSTSTSSDRIKVTSADDVIITLSSVQITSDSASPFEIDATGDVTLKLSGENILTATYATSTAYTVGYAGLQKTSTDKLLTITSAAGDGETDGSLNATGDFYGAGIGGGYYGDGSNITIAGGTIEATGGGSNYHGGAGIGGGDYGAGSYITITGGKVTAVGSTGTNGDSAGIGGGRDGSGSYITIEGGEVIAQGGSNGGAGIGGGNYGSGSDITITGGTVTATGGAKGAGIGGGNGDGCTGSNITISGGTVTATGGDNDGEDIGSGKYGSSATDIAISGGYITVSSLTSSTSVTGGYFADSYTDATTVYGCTVDAACTAYENKEDTAAEYPIRVLAIDWRATVTYDKPDDAEGEQPTATEHTYGETVTPGGTLPYTAESGSYIQVGWSLTEGSTDIVTSFVITEDTTLYPVFGRAFNGTDKEDSISLTYGEAAEIELKDYLQFVDSEIDTDGQFTFAVAEGSALPAGLTLAGGVISGTPQAAAEATDVSFIVTDNTPGYMTLSLDSTPAAVTATLTLTFTVSKATPEYTLPTGLTAVDSQTLATVALPSGWTWDDETTSVGEVGTTNSFPATYTPSDMDNYNTVTADIEVEVITPGDFAVTTTVTDGYTYSSNVLTISKGGEYTVEMADGVESTETDRIKVTAAEEVTITISNVQITNSTASPFEVDAAGDVTIKLDGENVLESSKYNCAGLQKTSTDNMLTITSEDGVGSLTATGGKYGAGIGGASNIEISGGYIIASSLASITSVTGGYFGTGDVSTNTVYDVAVASGYSVYENAESTKDAYPVRVLADDWAATSVTYNKPQNVTGTAPTYDGATTYGTLVNIDTTSYPYTYSGYKQIGWSLDEDSTEVVTSFYITEDEMTLYPVFARAFEGTDTDADFKLFYGVEIEAIDLNDYLQFTDSVTFGSPSGQFTFALADGSALPSGLELKDGVISGTPQEVVNAKAVSFTVTDNNPSYMTLFSIEGEEAVETTLTLTFAVSGYTLRAEVASTAAAYNPYDEITVDVYLSSVGAATVTAAQIAFEGDWYTVIAAEGVGSDTVAVGEGTNKISIAYDDEFEFAADEEKKIATVTLQVNEDAETDETAAINFDIDQSFIGTDESVPNAADDAEVKVYNLTLTLTTDAGASFDTADDPTTAYLRYDEVGIYSDAERTTAITELPQASASEGYELKDGYWTLTTDTSNEQILETELLANTWTESGSAIPTALKKYTVTLYAPSDEYGTITYDGAAVSGSVEIPVNEETTYGEIIAKIVFTTKDGTAYILDSWQLDDSDTYYTEDSLDTVAADAALNPHMVASEFIMTLENGDNWSFDTITGAEDPGSDEYTVTYKTDVEFTLDVAEGYAVHDVSYSVNGGTSVSLTADGDTFTIPGDAIIGDVVLEVNAIAYYEITFGAGVGSTKTDGTFYAWAGIDALYTNYDPLGLSGVLTTADTDTIKDDLAADTTDSETTGARYRLADDDTEPLWTDGDSTATTAELLQKVYTANTAYTAIAVQQYRVLFADGDEGFGEYNTTELSLWVDEDGSISGMGLTIPSVTAADYYEFAYWTVDSAGEYSDDELAALTITDTVTAVPVFTKINYKVTFTPGETGVFGDFSGLDGDEASGYTAQWDEEDITFTFVADENYDVTNIYYTVGGGSAVYIAYEEGKTYTIAAADITGEIVICVEAAEIRTYTFTIAAEDAAKGTLGSVVTVVTYVGDKPDMTDIVITESAGYYFAGWSYDDVTYSTDDIEGETVEKTTDNRTYTAVFERTDLSVDYDSTYLEITDGLDSDGKAHIEDDLVIEQVGDIAIITVTYSVGGGEEVTLKADDEGVYTIPGSVLTDDIVIIVTTVTDDGGSAVYFEFIEHDEYFGSGIYTSDTRKIALLTTNEINGSYKLSGGSTFYYSSQYGAYVMWVDAAETAATLSAKLGYDENGTPTEIAYDGDINKTGVVTAGDAGIINDILMNRYSGSLSDAQLFMLDVSDESLKEIYTSDVEWTLEESIKK